MSMTKSSRKSQNSQKKDVTDSFLGKMSSKIIRRIKTDTKKSEEINFKSFRILLDGNLKDFSVEDMEIFFRHNDVSTHVIKSLKRKGVNGRKFAAMTDDVLEAFGMKNPIILYFRQQSKAEKDQFIL